MFFPLFDLLDDLGLLIMWESLCSKPVETVKKKSHSHHYTCSQELKSQNGDKAGTNNNTS